MANAPPPKKRRVDNCGKCGKEITGGQLGRHFKTCRPKDLNVNCCYDCPYCQLMCVRDLAYIKKHIADKHEEHEFKCKRCGWKFTSDGFYEEGHINNCIRVTKDQARAASTLESLERLEHLYMPEFPEDPLEPPGPDHPIWDAYGDQKANERITERWFALRQHVEKHNHGVHKYVFRLVGEDVQAPPFHFADALLFIYANEECAFCFNVAEDYMLHKDANSEEEEDWMAYIPQNGQNTIFEKNILVHDLVTLDKAMTELDEAEHLGQETAARPDTAWTYVGALAYTFFVYIRPAFMLGGPGKEKRYPQALANKKGILSMLQDMNRNYFNDNLCFFRCLVNFLGGDYNNIEEIWTAYEKYRRQVNGPFWWEYNGIQMDDFKVVEKVFKINVQVYRFNNDGSIKLIRKPLRVKLPTLSIMYNKW